MNPSHRRMANLGYCAIGITLITSAGPIFADDSDGPVLENVASALNPANTLTEVNADRSGRIAFTHVQPVWPIDEDQRPDIDQADTDNYDSDDRHAATRHSPIHQQRLLVKTRNEAFAEFHKRFMTVVPKAFSWRNVGPERENNAIFFGRDSFGTVVRCSIIESHFGIWIVPAGDPFADDYIGTLRPQSASIENFSYCPSRSCSPFSIDLPFNSLSPSQWHRSEQRRLLQLEGEPVERTEWNLEIFKVTSFKPTNLEAGQIFTPKPRMESDRLTWLPLTYELSSNPFVRRSIDHLRTKPPGTVTVRETEDEILIVGVDEPASDSRVLVYRLSRLYLQESVNVSLSE